jgi:hypothetical protein
MEDAARVREITEHRSKAGMKGGKRSLETMTPEQRTERAKKAAAARTANLKRKKAK